MALHQIFYKNQDSTQTFILKKKCNAVFQNIIFLENYRTVSEYI